MKFLTLKTIACLFLALAMLSSASCGLLSPPVAEERASDGTEHRLTVEVSQVLYTPEELESFSLRLTQAARKLCFLSEGLVLNDSQAQRISDYVKGNVLPMLADLGVTADELGAVCAVIEDLLAEADRDRLPAFDRVCSAYREWIGILGSSRTGALLYESVLLWLDRQIALCDERYEKYHYAWYLEDGDRYRSQRTALTGTVGREDFSVMSGFWFFTLSAVSGAVSDGESTNGVLLLNDAEILMLLARQADYFNGRDLGAEQWRIVSELLCTCVAAELELPASIPSAARAVLSALQKDGAYAAQVGLIMPELLTLYASVISELTAEDVSLLKGEDAAARAAVFCRALAADEAALLNFASVLTRHASSADESQAKALKKLGLTEAYNAYAQAREPISEQALLAAIRNHAVQGTQESYAALRDAEERFVFGFLPYVAFALYGV